MRQGCVSEVQLNQCYSGLLLFPSAGRWQCSFIRMHCMGTHVLTWLFKPQVWMNRIADRILSALKSTEFTQNSEPKPRPASEGWRHRRRVKTRERSRQTKRKWARPWRCSKEWQATELGLRGSPTPAVAALPPGGKNPRNWGENALKCAHMKNKC